MIKKKQYISLLSLGLFINTCCLLCFSSILLGAADQVAIIGGETSLPCNFTMPSPDDSVFLIFWYRGMSKSPFYTVDARFSPLMKAKHIPRGLRENRYLFNLSSVPALLRISRIEESDEGEYRCRVDYRWARTHSTAVNLRVIVPATNIVIVDAHGDTVSGDIGPFNEGNDLRLVCRASGGRPPPTVTWRRMGEIIDGTYVVMDANGTSENELSLRKLHRSDLKAQLTCEANNNNATKSLTATVVIDLNLKPVDVHISTSSRPLTAGERAEIVCEALGARPQARIIWLKDNKPLTTTVAENWARGNLTSSKLVIKPTRDDDGKHLSCRADNHNIPDSAKQAALLLRVYYKPIVSVSIPKLKHKSEIYEDSSVELVCNITANPWVLDVSWYFNGKPLRPNLKLGVVIKNFSLILYNISREQSGHYQCSATNVVGKETSQEVTLSVMFSPVCKEGQKIVYGISKGRTLKVTCEVEADPEDVTFFWVFNNTYHKKHISSFFLASKLRSVANYKPKTNEDFGSLYCWARNIVGVQKEPCIFSVIPAGPPDPVSNCAFDNVTTDSVTLNCDVGHGEGDGDTYLLEVYKQGKLEANLSSTVPRFFVNDLPSATALVFVVYSSNSLGKSESITVSVKTKGQPLSKIGDFYTSFTPLGTSLEITLGCVTALFLLACSGILVLRRSMKKSRKAKRVDESKESECVDPGIAGLPPQACSTASSVPQPLDDPQGKGIPGPDVIPLAIEWNDLPVFQTGYPGETSQWGAYNGYPVGAESYDVTIHNTCGTRRKVPNVEVVPEYRLKSTLV